MEYSKNVMQAIKAFQEGKMVIIVDDYDRENEGDLVIPAEHATPEVINFMTIYGRGLICIAIDQSYADRLGLDYMVTRNEDDLGTAFTVSVDAAPSHGVTTGISAFDRARTIQVMLDPASRSEDLRRPGHMFPLIAKPGGTFTRRGHTEASTDLCVMAGLKKAAIIVEVLHPDGHMARIPYLTGFSKELNLPLVSVADIVQARRVLEQFSHEEVAVSSQ